jgi:phosphatidylinositol alpha-1,6-mannosyltransferase
MLFQAGLRNVDQFIAVSDWTRDQLVQQGVPESAVTVIHPGVDFHRFATGDCSECDLSPDSNRITLLTVARLDPRKGHDLVLRAIEDLNGVEYFIAGDGRSMEPLQGLAKERGLADRVTFLGYVNDTDLPAVYDCCDAFIMPGTPDTESVEGFGITYLEANAAGKPAIGSDIEGMAAAIKHGETGWLVSPDISEIRDAILDLEEQDISQMKEACQDWAKQHDWDRIVAEIDDKIDKIKE